MATHAAATRNISGLARALAQHGAHDRVRRRGAADAGAAGGRPLRRAGAARQADVGRSSSRSSPRARSACRCSTSPASTSTRSRRNWSTSRLPSRGAFCRCTSAATACSSPPPTRRTCRRWKRSGSRPTSSSSRSSSRTTSSRQAIAQARRGHAARRSRTWPRIEDLEVDLEDGDGPAGDGDEESSEVEDAPVVKYIQKILLDAISRRRLRHPLRALREVLPHPLPARRHPDGSRAAAARHQGQDRVADQGHLASSTSRKSACRRTAG